MRRPYVFSRSPFPIASSAVRRPLWRDRWPTTLLPDSCLWLLHSHASARLLAAPHSPRTLPPPHGLRLTAGTPPTSTNCTALACLTALRHPSAHRLELLRREDRAKLILLLPFGGGALVGDGTHRIAVAVLNGLQLGPLLGRELGNLRPDCCTSGRSGGLDLCPEGGSERNRHQGEHRTRGHHRLRFRRLCRVGIERTRVALES